jgi:hypothetical protein
LITSRCLNARRECCCKEFDKALKRLYMKDLFLRLPTATDAKNIVKLHKSVHSVDGWLP